MSTIFLGGIDIGQTTDPSALAILEKTGKGDTAVYAVRELKRFELMTPYETVVMQTLDLMATDPLKGAPLAIDQTGVGRAVVERFRRKGMEMYQRVQFQTPLYPITITAGHQATEEKDGWHVPKKDLVAVLMLLFQSNRLKIAKGLKHAALLTKELGNFRSKITLAANVVYAAWREGQHDDLVLALAMAAWLGNKGYGEAVEVHGGRRPFDGTKAPAGVFDNFGGLDINGNSTDDDMYTPFSGRG